MEPKYVKSRQTRIRPGPPGGIGTPDALLVAFPLGNLDDTESYCVQLRVEDRYGNLSDPSEALCLNTGQLPSASLRRGCSCNGAGGAAGTLILLTLLLPLWFRRRA